MWRSPWQHGSAAGGVNEPEPCQLPGHVRVQLPWGGSASGHLSVRPREQQGGGARGGMTLPKKLFKWMKKKRHYFHNLLSERRAFSTSSLRCHIQSWTRSLLNIWGRKIGDLIPPLYEAPGLKSVLPSFHLRMIWYFKELFLDMDPAVTFSSYFNQCYLQQWWPCQHLLYGVQSLVELFKRKEKTDMGALNLMGVYSGTGECILLTEGITQKASIFCLPDLD